MPPPPSHKIGYTLHRMTWGIKRRARAANILADLGKIVMAAAVIGPLVQAGSVSGRVVIGGLIIAMVCFTIAVRIEQEENHGGR